MYKDLSLKEKSELFKLMISNGITDINEIERIYNSYQGRGKINKFDEGGLNVTLPEVVVSPRNSYYNYTGEETNVPT